jgi:hypothetical protein
MLQKNVADAAVIVITKFDVATECRLQFNHTAVTTYSSNHWLVCLSFELLNLSTFTTTDRHT